MKKLRVTAAILAMVMLVATGCSATGKTEETTEETYSRSDIKDIRAQDDFYGYVNLATLKDLTIEPGKSSAGAIMSTETDDKLKEVVMEIVKDNKDYPNGSAEQIVKKAYEEYVAFDTDEVAKKAAADDVHKVIKEISDIKTRDELIEMAGKLYTDYCVNSFLLEGVKENDLDPEKYTVMFAQKPNLVGLDLEEISKDTTKAEKGEEAIIASLQVSGMERKEAESVAHSLMFLMIDIAWETDYEIVNAADPIAYSKSMDKSEIDKLLTNLTADQYEKLCGINENPYGTWVVIGENQLAAIDRLLTDENVEALKAWLMYDFVMSYGEFIKDDHKELKMYFPDSKEADEDQIYNYLNLYFGMELSDILVKYCYTDDQEELLNKLIEDIMDSYCIMGCNNPNVPLLKQTLADFKDEDFVNIQTVITALANHPRLKSRLGKLTVSGFIESYINMYDSPMMLALENFPYFVFNILSVNARTYINRYQLLENTVGDDGKKLYGALVTTIC